MDDQEDDYDDDDNDDHKDDDDDDDDKGEKKRNGILDHMINVDFECSEMHGGKLNIVNYLMMILFYTHP